ncbi:glutamine--fructose-6-phosphate transaminase (isomerizing) [Desulfoluna spongiiphila]|uniref:glutamine--fructose-6-phosphate transaminase (isomerizing) n=1 Tax=Desulfoluna spongiiphila TaxID=419481 RepID=UPI001255BDBC|nr:glutamine--fructose-6-phosphate transaminase (isomerizing) [Desulfoluna spongiiphila]VVS92353.1 glucosamine-fructose-6-phosphate aminotransferase isomerising [Desulfoluna spongiiphila]
MCGIVGAVARHDVLDNLIDGLNRLEYRGYDSAGVALVCDDKRVQRLRAVGKVAVLEEEISVKRPVGHIGVAHTRWATHGQPSVRNCHPHMSGTDLALVHNGIIENHTELRTELEADGYEFTSDTDTEVIVHLIHRVLPDSNTLRDAVASAVERLEGAYAIGVIHASSPDTIVAARHGSPLIIGLGDDGNYLASDQMALSSITDRFIYLEEGDLAEIQVDRILIHSRQGEVANRQVHRFSPGALSIDKGHYNHFMHKEIHEQARVMTDVLEGRLAEAHVPDAVFGVDAAALFDRAQHIQIIACGTSYHAGMVARYWLEEHAGIPCQVEIASEYRYRTPAVLPHTLIVTVSQSGETADTLAALRNLKDHPNCCGSLSICNVAGSSLIRESDLCLLTHAGPEIGVASTKAFTSQLVAFQLLTAVVGRRHAMTPQAERGLVLQLRELPALVQHVLLLDERIRNHAGTFADKNHTLFLGRGVHYPIAMEGALKLKEISYIHAEAYAAGELKHGPLALVDEEMPVVALVPVDGLFDKMKSNLQEVQARKGSMLLIASENACLEDLKPKSVIRLPDVPEFLAPVIYTIPLQLLSYHVALIKGTNVDQPRNLAKAVTVE